MPALSLSRGESAATPAAQIGRGRGMGEAFCMAFMTRRLRARDELHGSQAALHLCSRVCAHRKIIRIHNEMQLCRSRGTVLIKRFTHFQVCLSSDEVTLC